MAKEILELNKNTFVVVGELVEVNNKKDELSKNGKQYASCNYVIKSVIDGVENLFEVRIFSMATVKEGTASKKYSSIIDSFNWLNKRVKVIGTIKENRYWSANMGKVVSKQELNANSIFLADKEATDSATYEIAGYVYKQIAEVNNKNGEPYIYRLPIGQYDYNLSDGTKHLNIVTLDVSLEPTDEPKYRYISENYFRGYTVTLYGNLSATVKKAVLKTEVAFGDPIVREVTNIDRGFYIRQGSEPLDLDNGSAYSKALIEELEKNYAAEEVRIASEAKVETDSGMRTSTEAPKQTSTKSRAKLF